MKRIFLAILIIAGLIVGAWLFIRQPNSLSDLLFRCQAKEVIFYYSDSCSWCQKVKNEGTIEKIEQLGIKVTKINTAVGPIQHQFQGVPTFVINDKVYSGYKTFEELKELLGCSVVENQSVQSENQEQSRIQTTVDFFGEKGKTVILENGEVKIEASQFDDNQARFFNIQMQSGKTIYFFVVKDKNGIYRAAANACVVCFKTYKGFRQEGDEIVCNNCGNRYPIEKIATEKGGCNPGPINPNLEVEDGKIVIKQVDIEQVLDLF